MANGVINRHMGDKGFGFIRDARGIEWFFHRSATGDQFDRMQEGDAVTFDEGQGPKGPRAENVRLAQADGRRLHGTAGGGSRCGGSGLRAWAPAQPRRRLCQCESSTRSDASQEPSRPLVLAFRTGVARRAVHRGPSSRDDGSLHRSRQACRSSGP
jgi:CspA family cold shock protein